MTAQIQAQFFPQPARGTDGVTADLTAGTLDEGTDALNLDVHVVGEVPVENVIFDGGLLAADLPKVENSATAVSNNQSITADVPIYLHDAQFAAGNFNTTCGGDGESGSCPDALGFLIGAYGVAQVDGELQDLNEHTSIAGLLTVAAATGFIEPAAITASATVSDILNAYVENSATAVTNNASFTISSDNPANHVVVADLTQWGYANVSADASVTDVNLDNYSGFGAAGFGGGIGDHHADCLQFRHGGWKQPEHQNRHPRHLIDATLGRGTQRPSFSPSQERAPR